MSVNGLISIKNPIVDAMDDLAIDHDKFIPLFTRWATQAENEIGSKYQYETKRKVLNIEGCAACLPTEAVHIQTAILGDFGCDCRDLMASVCGCISSTFTTETPSFLIVDIGAGWNGAITGYINYSLQNNKLIFEQNFDGKQITIQYLAPATDDEGFVKVGQNHVLAIKAYIMWKYYFRKNNSNWMDNAKMIEAKDEWNRECSHARARDSDPTQSERNEIVYGMLHNPYIGISLSSGMHTTTDNGWGSW